MRVKTKTGKFAPKTSSLYKFVNRTGLNAEAYYKWASECGVRASNQYKDRKICEKYGIESIDELLVINNLDCSQFSNIDELNDYILNNSNNPLELAAAYLEIKKQFGEYQDKYDFIQANLSVFPKASFERWSDKNRISEVSPSWFNKNGIPLDVQAENLTEVYMTEISINDLVDFVLSYKKNKYVNPKVELIKAYWNKLEQICGFTMTDKYVEHLNDVLLSEENAEQVEESIVNDDLPF